MDETKPLYIDLLGGNRQKFLVISMRFLRSCMSGQKNNVSGIEVEGKNTVKYRGTEQGITAYA
ncbi:MAG: hypothetical protein K2O45_09905 [Oscillospiraceae bacterium]|nr:hypothetical protein [Oscillospiraceae bacterium]